MNTKRILITTAAALALSLFSPAEPEPPTEARIAHLEEAAEHLAEAGMMPDAKRLREQAALMRNDLRNRRMQIEEFAARLMALEEENQALRRQLEQARQPAPEPHPGDRAAAEAQRRQVMEAWKRIEEAARGNRPSPPQDPAPAPLPEAKAPADPAPRQDAPYDQAGVLVQILRTLQRIERKLDE